MRSWLAATVQQVRQVLQSKPERERLIVELYYRDRNFKEIAEIFGVD